MRLDTRDPRTKQLLEQPLRLFRPIDPDTPAEEAERMQQERAAAAAFRRQLRDELLAEQAHELAGVARSQQRAARRRLDAVRVRLRTRSIALRRST